VIVVDTNVFLRSMLAPETAQDDVMLRQSSALFRLAADGREQFTTSDAVIAEVTFALVTHYHLDRTEIAARLRLLLTLPGCRLPTKTRCIGALDLWESLPKLSFVDALVAVQARDSGNPLATFDRALARTEGVPIWDPAKSTDGTDS
jgi:predicted nucleic acid-binding protein